MENPVVLIAVIALALGAIVLGWLLRYQRGLRRVTADLLAAEEALDRGDITRARELVAPLLTRYPKLAVVQEVAADVLYASGDPLSAASLYERSMKKLGAPRVGGRLVAAYAALNRAGDARRVAALVPEEPLARMALAWSELAAVGGDRERGRALALAVASDAVVRESASADAMSASLVAIAAARAGDLTRMRQALARVETRGDELVAHDRAFIGYLVGLAQLEAGAPAVARATWTAAMEVGPESIGAALARRERSHLPVEASEARA